MSTEELDRKDLVASEEDQWAKLLQYHDDESARLDHTETMRVFGMEVWLQEGARDHLLGTGLGRGRGVVSGPWLPCLVPMSIGKSTSHVRVPRICLPARLCSDCTEGSSPRVYF